MTVPFMYNFWSLSNKFPTIFWRLIFHISLPQERLFFAEKGNLKLWDSKMSWREESEKFSLSFNGKLHLKFSGKSYWSPCNFEKAQVALRWPNRYKFHSWRGFTPVSTVLRKSVRFFITVIFLIIKNTFQVEFWPVCCLNDSETQEIGL